MTHKISIFDTRLIPHPLPHDGETRLFCLGGKASFTCHCPRKDPSLGSLPTVFSILEFLLLRLPCISLPKRPLLCWWCCRGHVHFIFMHPFSWGLEYWYVITEMSIYSSCPQIPSQSYCSFIPRCSFLFTVPTSDFQVYAGHMVVRPPFPAPIRVASPAYECSFASGVSEI